MQTYSVNSLAEQFEVDRGTMVKAMRDVPPDTQKTAGRPLYTVATAARALEAHRAKTGRIVTGKAAPVANNSLGPDPTLTALYAQFDLAEAAMKTLTTLAARRKAAIAMAPIITATEAAMFAHGKSEGTDPELTGYRASQMRLLICRGLEKPCEWPLDVALAAISDMADA